MGTRVSILKTVFTKKANLRGIYYLLAVIVFFALLVTGSIVFIKTQAALREERIYNELMLSVKGVAGRVYAFIEGKKGRVVDFCSDGVIKDGLTWHDPDDPEVSALIKDTNEHLIKNKLSLDTYLEDILVLNLKGKIIFSTNERLLGEDKSKKGYFLAISRYFRDNLMLEKLKETPRLITYMSDFYFSDDLKRPVLAISNIITARRTGLPLGVLVNRYQGNSFDKLLNLEKDTMSETGKVYMINSQRLLLTVPKFLTGGANEIILKRKIESLPLIKAYEDAAETHGIYKDFRGEKVLGASMLMEDNDWIILAEEDAERVSGAISRLTLQIIVIGMISMCVVIGVSFLIARLERNIAGKAKQLEESRQQMFQAEKMAALGQLSGSIAHEIKNPLTGALNNIQLLKLMLAEGKDINREDLKKIADAIENSALTCAEVSLSLMDFSRASSDMFYPVSLNKIIEKVSFILSREARHKNIALEKHLDEGLPDVYGDTQLLQQVIFNLINNAIYAVENKFRSQEGGRVRIVTRYEPAKNAAEAIISDNGIGIAAEDMDKLFKPFFTTKPAGQGTGLGLSIVHNIITKHSGSINVESKPGEGTAFVITLPVFNKRVNSV